MRRSFSFLFSLIFLSGPLYGSDLINLIHQGNLEEARAMMDRNTTAARRDGQLLFGQALLEPSGDKSLQLLETAQQTGVPVSDAEDLLYQKCMYFLAAGSPEKVIEITVDYLQRWENGHYRKEILRLQAWAYEAMKDYPAASRINDILSREDANGQSGLDARLIQANALIQQKKSVEALKGLKKLIKSQDGDIAASALYLLCLSNLDQRKSDDALFYYNLLKEEFPEAVGLDDLTDRLSQVETAGGDESAEKITGTTYSVQVGTFSVKENAGKMAERMKKYSKSVKMIEKTISGKIYYVVIVGKFLSSEKAMTFKAQLETSENETFQVIAQ